MKRRDFVLGGLAAPLVAACVSPGGASANWPGLQSRLEGELLLPDSAGFETGRKLFNTRFDGISPSAVARCKTARDVRACVDYARRGGIPIHVRSGGHS